MASLHFRIYLRTGQKPIRVVATLSAKNLPIQSRFNSKYILSSVILTFFSSIVVFIMYYYT